MTQDNPQQRSSPDEQNGGQDQDPLAELEAKESVLHTGKHHHSRSVDGAPTADRTNQGTAKETDTPRGHDTPQSVRHSG